MIADIHLQHFRSYSDASFEFGSGVNIIVGPNGSGKTNLLEALQIIAIGSSYRAKDAELLQFSAPWMRLDALLHDSTRRTVKLTAAPELNKSYEIAEKEYKRLTLQHTVPVVLFEPNHLLILHGAPEGRRAYLDDILEQTSPGYATYRRNYRRVLAQRNALLKRHTKPSGNELFPWDLRLSELGAVLARARADLADTIAKDITELYTELSHADTVVSVRYGSTFPIDTYETNLLHALEQNRHNDLARGFTGKGPHREDLEVLVDDKPVDEVASRGETRTIVLGLKIIELQLLEEIREQTPLLLLDDVFSELDGSRRRALTSYLQRYQTFLTTTDADVVVKHFTDSTIIPLSLGTGA